MWCGDSCFFFVFTKTLLDSCFSFTGQSSRFHPSHLYQWTNSVNQQLFILATVSDLEGNEPNSTE